MGHWGELLCAVAVSLAVSTSAKKSQRTTADIVQEESCALSVGCEHRQGEDYPPGVDAKDDISIAVTPPKSPYTCGVTAGPASSTLPSHERQPHVCVIVRTYIKQTPYLRTLIHSLLANDYMNMTISVVDTEAQYQAHDSICDVVDSVKDCRVTIPPYSGRREAFPTYGYHQTDEELDRLLAEDHSPCEYFLFTNGDNAYSRHFLHEVRPLLVAKRDLVGVHFISGHYWPKRGGKNLLIETQWEHMKVDLGAVLVRSDVIGDVRFMKEGDSVKEELWDADWRFFAALLDKNATTAITPQVLFMHM
jgi:hypothetical protein